MHFGVQGLLAARWVGAAPHGMHTSSGHPTELPPGDGQNEHFCFSRSKAVFLQGYFVLSTL